MTTPQISEYSAFIPAICFGPDNKILEKPVMLKPCRHRVSEADLQKYEQVCHCGSAVIKSKRDSELESTISVCLQNRTVVDLLVREVKNKDQEMAAYKAQVQPRLEKLDKIEKRALDALKLKPRQEALPAKPESEPVKQNAPQLPAESSKTAPEPRVPNPPTPPYQPLTSDPTATKDAESVPVVAEAMDTTPVEKPAAQAMIPVAMEVIAVANDTIPVIAPVIPAQPEAAPLSIKITLKKQAKRPSEETSEMTTEVEKQIPPRSPQAPTPKLPTFPKKPKAKEMNNIESAASDQTKGISEGPVLLKKKWSQLFQNESPKLVKPKAAAKKASAKPVTPKTAERMPIPKKPAAPAIQASDASINQPNPPVVSSLKPTPIKPPTNVITFAAPAAPKAPAATPRGHTTIDMTGSMAKPAPAVQEPAAPAQTATIKQSIQPQVASEVQAYFGSPLPTLAPKDTAQGAEQRKPLLSELDALLGKILASKEAAKNPSAIQEKKQ